MIRKSLSVAALLASTSFATAQSQGAFADWSGAYAGLSASAVTGTIFVRLPSGSTQELDWEDSTTLGGFAGYNWQNGNIVYGAELGLNFTTDDMMISGAGSADDFVHSLIDLRVRAGYAIGDALVYGAVGLSALDVTFNVTDDEYFLGVNVGVGVDYQLSDSMFVGIDYTARQIDGDVTNPANPFETENTFNTLSLRAAYRF